MRLKQIGTLGVVSLLTVGTLTAADRDASLATAVKEGDKARVATLLRARTDANSADPDGTTALHWAVQRDDVETMDLLLRAGANATTANRYGVTPLLVACTNGNAAAIDRLLRAGADPNSAAPGGETALMTAARTGKVDAVTRLLESGADAGAKESVRGQTALMWAAAEDHVGVIQTLLKAGADPKSRSTGGFTALHFSVRAGKLTATNALLDGGADVNDALVLPARAGAAGPRPEPQTPPAGVAAPAPAPAPAPGQANGGVEQLVRVFNSGSRGGRGAAAGGTSPLVLAITNGHFEVASALLDRGADPNAAAQGWSALHQLAWTRRPPIQHGLPPAVPTGSITSLELAEKLLQYGADPDLRMTREPSDGARNILNRIGSTPFLQAAKQADIPYMRLLIAYGADPSITTEEGATPMMAAAGVGIWQVGENPGTNEEAFEAVKICHALGNDVNVVDAKGNTALHGAAHRGSNDIVKFLVDRGAKLDVVNKLGWTPWIIANGVMYPNTFNRRLETAALLLSLGADPKAGKRRPEDAPPSEETPIAALERR